MSGDLGPGPRTRVRRMPELARYDESTVFAIVDAAPFCHVAAVVDGRACVQPTLHVRRGRRLYFHGSASNALFRELLRHGEACVSLAVFDGLRLARSGFESSVAYRSVVAYGPVFDVDDEERREVLELFVERTLPGRRQEVRPLNASELARTQVIAMDVTEASAKISSGPTDDDESDQALPLWSGVIPARVVYGAPLPSGDGAMARGMTVPPSVRRATERAADPRRDRLLTQLERHQAIDDREQRSLDALRDRLTWLGDPFDERADPRHVTASAFVVSSRGIVLHRHRILGLWVQPGGHVDAGEWPEDAAVREVREETGLVTVAWGEGSLFHVDLHQGPRGHTHYDLRYVLCGDDSDPRPDPGESPDVGWYSFARAQEIAEPALRAALRKVADAVRNAGSGTLNS